MKAEHCSLADMSDIVWDPQAQMEGILIGSAAAVAPGTVKQTKQSVKVLLLLY